MASARDIKRRIRSVQNSKKITKAMEMVSAAKLRKSQERTVAARPYAQRLAEALREVAAHQGDDVTHPLLAKARTGRTVYCVITADRGLAGPYNGNIIRLMNGILREADEPIGLVVVGRKGNDFFKRRGADIIGSFLNLGEEARFSNAEEIAEALMGLFVEGKAKEVKLVYTEFVSAVSLRPKVLDLLPVAPQGGSGESGGVNRSYIHIPSAKRIIEELLPKLVKNQVYQALLESKASEHAARMTAMRSASDNAQGLIEDLTLQYNRARQAGITTEILEVVGGAAALNG